jgi:hypothetical protein
MTPALNQMVELCRDGQHDDLVLAVAIVAFEAERYVPFRMFIPDVIGGRWPGPW